MFGIFRKRKRRQIAAFIGGFINTSLFRLRSGNKAINAGNLPNKLMTDRFALGYMLGIIQGGLHVFGVSETQENGLVTFAVFDLLFPGNGVETGNRCSDWAEKKETLFMNGLKSGIAESSVFFKGATLGTETAAEEAVGCLKTFEKYISSEYLQSNDT